MFPTWLKNSRYRPLELILDLRLDEIDAKVYDAWDLAYDCLASRRLDKDIVLNLAPHVSRLTRLDIHFHDPYLTYDNLWPIFGDAINLRELALSVRPNQYITFPESIRLPPIVALSLRRFGFVKGFDYFKSSLRRLKLGNEDTWATTCLEDVVSWINTDELTELHLYPRAFEVLTSVEQLGKPFTFSALRTLHFYNFEAEELTYLLPVISAPAVEDFLLIGHSAFLSLLNFLKENDTYTFPKCTILHLGAACAEPDLDQLDALAEIDALVAAFPNVTRLHVRDTLSDVVLQRLLPLENENTSSVLWPKLTSVSFSWNEGNSAFHDQLFRLVEARRNSNNPLASIGYTCPDTQIVDEGRLQPLKKHVKISRLEE
jgi:hypothetical protein